MAASGQGDRSLRDRLDVPWREEDFALLGLALALALALAPDGHNKRLPSGAWHRITDTL